MCNCFLRPMKVLSRRASVSMAAPKPRFLLGDVVHLATDLEFQRYTVACVHIDLAGCRYDLKDKSNSLQRILNVDESHLKFIQPGHVSNVKSNPKETQTFQSMMCTTRNLFFG